MILAFSPGLWGANILNAISAQNIIENAPQLGVLDARFQHLGSQVGQKR
jgi:hypothetical protein